MHGTYIGRALQKRCSHFSSTGFPPPPVLLEQHHMTNSIRTMIATAALLFAPLVARATESTPLERCVAAGGAVAKATIINPDTGAIRVVTRCVK